VEFSKKNIMTIKVCDFGVSKIISHEEEQKTYKVIQDKEKRKFEI
jgi:hypothetical protein